MSHAQPTLDGKTFAIGVLSITACILFVGFLLVTTFATPAYGIGQSDRGGDYIMLTQQLSTSTEGIVVVDAASQQAILYGFDYNKREIVILNRIPLDRLRKPREERKP